MYGFHIGFLVEWTLSFVMTDGFTTRPLWNPSETNKSLEQNIASEASSGMPSDDYDRSGQQDDGNEEKSRSRQRPDRGNCNGSFMWRFCGTSPKVNKLSGRFPVTCAAGSLP